MTNDGRMDAGEALLRTRGADSIDHPGGTLLAHLVRVASLLAEWGADDDVQLAGLCHAAYGTDGFGVALLGLDERALVIEAIGQNAEALVYCTPAATASRPIRNWRSRSSPSPTASTACDARRRGRLSTRSWRSPPRTNSM